VDIALILILIVVNGIFAMSEMSLVSAGKARLQKLADDQRAGAQAALKLHEEPSRFLSTVQVGITSVGILSGALGETALTEPLMEQLSRYPLLLPYADTLALVITVITITYFSVVVGELVPKRLALRHPEGIALFVARPMNFLALVASPLVWLLSSSSNLILRVMRAHQAPHTTVSNEEIKIMMDMGAEAGVFHASEGQLVSNVLRLDEQRVGSVMTPRKDVVFIDLDDDADEINHQVAHCSYARMIVCRGGLDNILGILQRSDLLKALMVSAAVDITAVLRQPLYVPDSMSLPKLLEFFREQRNDFALIVDEYGDLEGLVTLGDVLEAIVGDIPSSETQFDSELVQRDDGSWLVDAGVSMSHLKSAMGIAGQFPGETNNAFNTVGGFILYTLERIPRIADNFSCEGWYFEVVDIDGTRIDKVLVAKQRESPVNTP